MTSCALLLIAAVGVEIFGSSAGIELTYAGRLTPVAVSDEAAEEKGFTVFWSLVPDAGVPSEALFSTSEDIDALPWPDRFGICPPVGDDSGPRIGYRFGGHDYTVALPGVLLDHHERLAHENEVIDGPLRLTVTGEKRIGDRDCRVVEVGTNFGREKTLFVEQETGLVVRYEEQVFLGRGDRFRLTLELTESLLLDTAQAATRTEFVEMLKRVETITRPDDRDPAADLSAQSLAELTGLVAPLVTLAKATPYEPLAATVERGVGAQQIRAEGVSGLIRKAVGSPAPPFDLKDLDGKPIDPASLKDKIVVLHFWEYDNDTLAAPYGQVGYLDFLHRRREKLGVMVLGVAVSPAFGQANSRRAAVRSAKNLAGFMNVGYRIAIDDGALLRAFGDPRPVGATLPLWVVIGPDGVVRSYTVGLFDVEPNEGLKELDAAVVELVREQKRN